MKLTAVLLFIAALHVSAGVRAQKITLTVRQAPLSAVFNEISRQTGLSVMYDEELIRHANLVTIAVKDASLEETLHACLKDQPFGYSLVNGAIVIRQAAVAAPDKPSAALPPVEIHGRVMDSTGVPLAGASVTVKGTKKAAATTNEKGEFNLHGVDPNAEIIITYTGFEPQAIRLQNRTSIDIVLKRSTSPLDVVQVIAYGENTQRFNVGSVATVTAEQIAQQPNENVLLDLQGRVPGLTATPTSGAPGAAVQVQIRGQNTVGNTPGSYPFDQPLFIVDGVPFAPQNTNVNQFISLATGDYSGGSAAFSAGNPNAGLSPFGLINPLDIESITVLKDADATAIYGSQGANGVVLITTKKGVAGKTNLSISATTGPVKADRTIRMMNTQQYLAMRRQGDINDGFPANPAQPLNNPDIFIFDSSRNTDWFKQFFGGTANNTSVHASLTGGSANTTFIVSVGGSHQTYDFPGGFAENTYTLHTAFHHNSSDHRLAVDFGSDFSYDQNNSSGNPSVLEAYTLAPNYPALLNPGGSLVWTYEGYNLATGLYVQNPNPMAYLKQSANSQMFSLNDHLQVSYKLLTGLTLSSTFGYSRVTNQEYSATPISSQDPVYSPVNSASFGNNTPQLLDVTPQITFARRISKGNFSAIAGGEYKKSINSSNSISGSNYANDALLGSIDGAATVSATDNFYEYKYSGVFGRLNYIWDQKYIISLTGRRDGSSNFGPGRQFGNFGSAAGGWIFSEEPWLKASKYFSFLSYGKLRLSYGTSGGDGIAPYQYQPNWAARGDYFSFQGIVPYAPVNLFNTDYSWDLTKKIDAAIELGFFKDRFLLSFGTYQARTSNQLIESNLPGQTGFTSVVENSPAVVQDRGLEISISSVNVKGRDFSWRSSFNISRNNNKLIAFPGLATSSFADYYVIGKSTSVLYGYKYLGVNPQTGLFQFATAKGQPTYNPANNLYTKGGDQVPIVNLIPEFQGGFSNTFSYKGFSLMLFFNFSKKPGLNYIGAVYRESYPPGFAYTNQPVEVLNGLWQKPGDVAQFQRESGGSSLIVNQTASAFERSNGSYSDASYIKLKTCSLAWNLPVRDAKKMGVKGASINLNAQNLFTITRYQVLDPENPGAIYSFPLQRTIVGGLNLTF